MNFYCKELSIVVETIISLIHKLEDLFGSLKSRLRVLFDAAVEMAVVLPQALEVDLQLLEVPLQLLVCLYYLLIVVLVHLRLPVYLLPLLPQVTPLELFRQDHVLKLRGFELRP